MSSRKRFWSRPQLEELEDRSLPNNLVNPVAGSMSGLFWAKVDPDDLEGSPAMARLVGSFAQSTADPSGHGNLGNPRVAPPQSNPYGQSYSQWSAAWWQYALSIPTDQSPFLDTSGVNFSVGQTGNVWYLSGTFCLNPNGQPCTSFNPATVVRDVTLRSGISLFFPILNSEADNLNFVTGQQDLGFTIPELRAQAKAFIDDTVGHLTCTIDGTPVQNLDLFRVTSPVFSYTLPANNIAGVPAQTVFPAVSDGVFLMVRPLSVGQHTIHFTGAAPDFNFALDVTYNITVTSGKN
jgi:hypothetical protein